MSEFGPLVSAYVEMSKRFNNGEASPFDGLLASDCTFYGDGQLVGRTCDEITKTIGSARKHFGWLTHEVVAGCEADDVAAILAVNTYADGRKIHVAGSARYRDGKIVQLTSVGGMPQ